MARFIKNPLAQAAEDMESQGKEGEPKLVIQGHSTLTGRASSLLRVRPTLVEDINKVCVGPQYMIIDVALQLLLSQLNERSKPLVIKAETLNPSQEDVDILVANDRVPAPRKPVSRAKLRPMKGEPEPA